MKKWKNLVDTFRRKYDQSGSCGTPIADRVLQWRFYDRPRRVAGYERGSDEGNGMD